MSLHDLFEQSFVYQVFRKTILSENILAVTALLITFNHYLSVQLFELLLKISITSSGFNKALVYFLIKMDFDGIFKSSRLLNLVIDKLLKIS
jgi:hypothetical protein